MLAKRFAFDELRGNESRILGCSDFVNRQDVRMIQRRRSFRFLDKALETVLIRGKTLRKDLDRNHAVQLGIKREINLAHATSAELRADFVMTKFFSSFECH